MSPSPSRRTGAVARRRGVLAAGLIAAACSAAGAPVAQAAPVSLTLNYQCTFPLIDPQPLKLTIKSDIPATTKVGAEVPAFKLDATAEVVEGAAYGLRAVESASIEGSATAAATITIPGSSALPLQVPTTIAKTPVPATGGFTTTATGSTPPLAFPAAGTSKITVGDLVLTLTPRLADGTLTGLDTFETECVQVPGQNTTLASIVITPNEPGTGTEPGTQPTSPPVKYGYTLTGSSAIRTMTKGNVPLSGSIDARLTLATGAFDADLKLNPARANLTALGFLPISANLAFDPVGTTTGKLAGGTLTSTSKVNIRLAQIYAFGSIPLANPGTCRTRTPSTIPLKGTSFDPLKGGTLTGTYAISDLVGCGFLNGIVSPLTAGSGNTITLKLAAKTAQ